MDRPASGRREVAAKPVCPRHAKCCPHPIVPFKSNSFRVPPRPQHYADGKPLNHDIKAKIEQLAAKFNLQ